jgi:hypothetical protein
MIPSQYIILAEEIKKGEHNLFNFSNVCQQLTVNKLPARGMFDVAILCGPGWEAGKYRIHVAAMAIGTDTPQKIGVAEFQILNDGHTYTVTMNQVNLHLDNNNGFLLQVFKETGNFEPMDPESKEIRGNLIVERPVYINVLAQEAIT